MVEIAYLYIKNKTTGKIMSVSINDTEYISLNETSLISEVFYLLKKIWILIRHRYYLKEEEVSEHIKTTAKSIFEGYNKFLIDNDCDPIDFNKNEIKEKPTYIG